MSLKGKRVAVLVEKDYQDLEVWYPIYRLREEGATVVIVGTGATPQAYNGKYGYPIKAETTAQAVRGETFDGVVVPGGWAPDFIRRDRDALDLVRRHAQAGKLVAGICHAGWVFASAGILKGRTVTFFEAIRDDVVNAGAEFLDREVVVDGNLITSRKPDDLPAFLHAIISELSRT